MTAWLFHTSSLLVFCLKALIRITNDIHFNPCRTTKLAVDNLKNIKGILISSFTNKVIHCDFSLRMLRTLAVMCLLDYLKLVYLRDGNSRIGYWHVKKLLFMFYSSLCLIELLTSICWLNQNGLSRKRNLAVFKYWKTKEITKVKKKK